MEIERGTLEKTTPHPILKSIEFTAWMGPLRVKLVRMFCNQTTSIRFSIKMVEKKEPLKEIFSVMIDWRLIQNKYGAMKPLPAASHGVSGLFFLS